MMKTVITTYHKKENEDEEETKEDSEIETSATIDVDMNTAECDKGEI